MATDARRQDIAPEERDADTPGSILAADDTATQDVALATDDDATYESASADAITRDPRLPQDNADAPNTGDSGMRRYVRLSAPSLRAGWRYVAEGRRDLRLDLLRGFAVFAMVVDHIGGASWLYALTGGNRFFVSAAEGFVFISGLLVGIIYGDRMRRDGLRSATLRLLARAWTLYSLAVWLAIGTAFFAAIFGMPRGVILAADPARFIVEVITLQRTFYLVDVMLLYAFLLALSPLALAALRIGGWWSVLLVSCTLWAVYQSFPVELALPWRIVDNPVFNFAPWQLLFFVGLLIGYGRAWLARTIVDRIPRSPLNDGWVALPLALTAALISIHATNGVALARYVPNGDTARWLDFWFDKSALPLPRLAACAIVFATFWLVVTRFWVPIRDYCGWLLLPLGQRALYAYAAHLFLVAAIQVIIRAVWGHGRESGYSTLHAGIDAAIQIAGVGLLLALTRARFLQEVVAPLGRAPFAEGRWRWRRWSLPRPSDALAALLVVAIVSGLLLLPGGLGLRAGGSTAIAPAQTSGNEPPLRVAPPESTVTVPRTVGGSVRGSSGLTGRSDELTPWERGAGRDGGGDATGDPVRRAGLGGADVGRLSEGCRVCQQGAGARDAVWHLSPADLRQRAGSPLSGALYVARWGRALQRVGRLWAAGEGGGFDVGWADPAADHRDAAGGSELLGQPQPQRRRAVGGLRRVRPGGAHRRDLPDDPGCGEPGDRGSVDGRIRRAATGLQPPGYFWHGRRAQPGAARL
jgi:hypothetical protein